MVYMDLDRTYDKSTIWSSWSWWTLPFTIPWSFLLPCPWY